MKLTKIFALAAAAALTLTAASCGAKTKKIESIDDLAGAKIGVQLGTTGDIYISGDVEGGVFPEATVEKYNKGVDAIQALKVGKIDAVVIDSEPAKAFVAANSDLAILEAAYAEEEYAICIAKDNPDLTAAFNGAIAELTADGTMDAIFDKYINKTEGAEGYVTPDGTEYPNGELVMATNAYFEPYEYYDGDVIVGYDAEFAKAICDKLGYELVIEDMEFDSIIAAVQSGKADFGAAGMTVTEDRLESIDFTDSYANAVQVIVYKK